MQGVIVNYNGRALNPRLDLRNHSPEGLEWGYNGSGPAQLALAICAHALGDDIAALSIYQEFKDRCVSEWKGESWKICKDQVLVILRQIMTDRPKNTSTTSELTF